MNYPFIKIIDNFYDDPDGIRNHALEQKYQKITPGFYMGNDTINRNIINDECREKIQKVFEGKTVKVVAARYRHARSNHRSLGFVHTDLNRNDGKGYHVIIYLTPDEFNIEEDGICFFEHEKLGRRPGKNFNDQLLKKDAFNMQKFQMYHKIDYKYNRAVIVDYDFFHSSSDVVGYGDSLKNCRLVQIIEVVL